MAMPLLYRVKTDLSNLYQFHGPRFPLVIIHRFFGYYRRKFAGPGAFELGGKPHAYYIHPSILDNERAVEVALARDFIQGKSGEILEIGNVMARFIDFPHEVVDKYEIAPGVINEDVVTFSPGKKYDWILTLSTLEHVGWDEQPRDPQKIPQAIAHLKSLLKDSGQMLVTMPLGYNPHVDELVQAQKTGFDETRYLLRVSADNRWREATLEEVRGIKFGSPFSCGNGLVVGLVQKKPEAPATKAGQP